MTSHLEDYHLSSLLRDGRRLRSDHEDLSASHFEPDYFVQFEVASNILLPFGYRGALSVNNPSVELIEDTLGGISGDRIYITRQGHYTLYAKGVFGNKNDDARLYVNLHDVSGNPQVRYIANLPTGEAERSYVLTTRTLEIGQYVQLELENTDTNPITFLGRYTDASGFEVVPSSFILARSQQTS